MAKKAYIGVDTDIPIYTEETKTISITADNIADYFTVVNGSTYYFAGSGDTFTTNNGGVNSSTATTTLTAKMDMDAISFNYSYSSEANYDKFTLAVAGTTVESAVSGATTSKSYSGSLSAGDTISFTYAKDGSTHSNDDKCTFSGMRVTATLKTQTGTETKPVARKIKKGYVGVEQAGSYTLKSNGVDEFEDGTMSVIAFDRYTLNNDGTLSVTNPTTTTLEDLWGDGSGENLYFHTSGTSAIRTIYQLYDYYEAFYGDHSAYVYEADVFTVTSTGTVQVARKIKKAYIGIGGVARLCWAGVDPVFSNNTWEQIIDACQNGSVPDTWLVGDQKTMMINGIDYAIDIIGKNHDTYADGSGTAPLTFQLHDCYGTEYGMNTSNTNSGGWESSNMRATVLPSIMALMPPAVQSAIREVSKKTSAGSQSTTIHTTADKLFLLSEVEIFGSSADKSVSGEGTQYEYYSAGNSKVKNFNGSADYWWERSPRSSNTTYFCLVFTSGTTSANSASASRGVSFAFCF